MNRSTRRWLADAAPSVLAALRPRQWAHFTVLPLAAWEPARPLAESLPALARGAAIAATVLAYGYLLNAIADRELDRDPEKNPLIRGEGPLSLHRGTTLGLALGAVALAATGPRAALAATLVALVAGAVYSTGPRLKGWPGVCTALNVLCFAPLLFTGLASETLPEGLLALAAAFAALLFQNQLVHEAADAREDRAGGLVTTFLVAGPRGTAALASVTGLGVLIATAWRLDVAGVPVALSLAALPFVVVVPAALARRGHHAAAMRRLRRLHRLGAAGAGALLFLAGLLPALVPLVGR